MVQQCDDLGVRTFRMQWSHKIENINYTKFKFHTIIDIKYDKYKNDSEAAMSTETPQDE